MSVKVVFSKYDDFGADIVFEGWTEETETKLKELNNKYPFKVEWSLDGYAEARAELYCESFEEAQKEFDYRLKGIMEYDAEYAGIDFPTDKAESYMAACAKVGEWDSGASWEISILPSNADYIDSKERKTFMVANGIAEKDYDEAVVLIADYEP